MPELEGKGESEDRCSADEQAEATLMERLRLMATSLTSEFAGLSPSEAERLLMDSARRLLSQASVVQFVPILAARQARRLAQDFGRGDVVVDLTNGPDIEVLGAATTSAAPRLRPRAPTGESPLVAAFYAEEAKRLLEKAQQLRAAVLATRTSRSD